MHQHLAGVIMVHVRELKSYGKKFPVGNFSHSSSNMGLITEMWLVGSLKKGCFIERKKEEEGISYAGLCVKIPFW